ncbi:MAG: hypothetical protein HC915_19300, partial [Anaerolineae bacterium]|nr:hypothetical protein [Anaerolineae bacterium]
MTDGQPTPPPQQRPAFEDLTLDQVFWLMLYRPVATFRRLMGAVLLPTQSARPAPAHPDLSVAQSTPATEAAPWLKQAPAMASSPEEDPVIAAPVLPRAEQLIPAIDPRALAMFAGVLLAIIFALIGARRLWNAATTPALAENNDLSGAEFWFVLAAMSYGGVALSLALVEAIEWLRRRPST